MCSALDVMIYLLIGFIKTIVAGKLLSSVCLLIVDFSDTNFCQAYCPIRQSLFSVEIVCELQIHLDQ